MNPLSIPELFCLISINLNDKEKIFLISCSKKIHGLRSLLILDSEYDLDEINDKYCAKSIIIKEFMPKNKINELIENLIPESIMINSKCVKFVSNNTNVKLFYNTKIIKKMVLYGYSRLAMEIMLNNDRSIYNINEQFIKSSEYGYLEVAKSLIELGANIHARNNLAIIRASFYGHLSMVKLLVKLGANIRAQDNLAIISASDLGHLSIVKLLIELGPPKVVPTFSSPSSPPASSCADVHARNNLAIIRASNSGHLSVVKLLIKLGANIYAQNNLAVTRASNKKHLSVAKLLIELGANIHAQNNKYSDSHEFIDIYGSIFI